MTIEEIHTVVEKAARLRAPKFSSGTRVLDKVPALEDHMLTCAYVRGELEDAWRHCARAVAKLEENLPMNSDAIWTAPRREAFLRENQRDVWGALRDARQLKAEIERQIHRLSKDEAAVSRAYTFITGNA